MIHGLYNEEGFWCEEDSEIEGIISSYFGELFHSSYLSVALMDVVLENVAVRVTSEMNNQLALPFSRKRYILLSPRWPRLNPRGLMFSLLFSFINIGIS